MALKEPYMVKCVIGPGNLELEADPGESFLVKDIQIYNPAQNYLTVTVAKATVGYFRIKGPLGSHLPFLSRHAPHFHDLDSGKLATPTATHDACAASGAAYPTATDLYSGGQAVTNLTRTAVWQDPTPLIRETILGYLARKGIFKGYPIPTGEKLVLSGAAQAGAIQLVIYEIYDEGDMKADMPNGPAATEYFFLNYGNCGGNISTTGDHIYNTPVSPAEFPDFPYGKDVPAKTEITIHGILGSDFAPGENDGTNYSYTKYLKLIRERITLFDEDKNGLLFYNPDTTTTEGKDRVACGYSLIGNFSSVDTREPLMFPTPLVFTPGEELGVYVTLEAGGTGQNLAIDEHEIAMIEYVKRV